MVEPSEAAISLSNAEACTFAQLRKSATVTDRPEHLAGWSGMRIDLLLKLTCQSRLCFLIPTRDIGCVQPTDDRWIPMQSPPKLLDAHSARLPRQIYILSSQRVLPAYLWPFRSHLSSVPNLVGRDNTNIDLLLTHFRFRPARTNS